MFTALFLTLLTAAPAAPSAYPDSEPGACIVYSCAKDSKHGTGDACRCVTYARSRPPSKDRKPAAKPEAPAFSLEPEAP